MCIQIKYIINRLALVKLIIFLGATWNNEGLGRRFEKLPGV